MTSQTNAMPLLSQSFGEIRHQNGTYVDKTDIIGSLARMNDVFLFTRPSGFGKTLLLSTFENLFSEGLKNFAGLRIGADFDEPAHAVISLSLSGLVFDSGDSFARALKERVCLAAQKSLPSAREKLSAERLITASFGSVMRAVFGCVSEDDPAVLLIDDYDAPLEKSDSNPELNKAVLTHLRNFYTCIKTQRMKCRFIFITGTGEFSGEGPLSDLNCLTDLTHNAA